MAGFLRFLLAAAALPFACGLARSVFDLLAIAEESRGLYAFLAGLALCAPVAFFADRFSVFYVFAHELTHAAAAVLSGGKASDFKVGKNGGSVKVTKTGVWITLSPYVVPAYTVAVGLAALAVRLAMGRVPAPWAWLAAVGFTWGFHAVYTVRSLGVRQPDVLEYGRFFSYVFIWVFNAAALWAGAACAASAGWRDAARILWARCSGAYAWTWETAGTVCEFVRSLPFLQG